MREIPQKFSQNVCREKIPVFSFYDKRFVIEEQVANYGQSTRLSNVVAANSTISCFVILYKQTH